MSQEVSMNTPVIKILSLSVDEHDFLSRLLRTFKFEKMEQAILFYAEIADTLYGLQKSGKMFYAGMPGKPESYEEVGFEFEPQGQ